MFGAYLQGFIGIFFVVLGVGFITWGLIPETTPPHVVVGFLMAFGGGYMRYLSSQTTRSVDMYNVESRDTGRLDINNLKFDGERNVENEDYQLFLVEKYGIIKNETLERYVLNGKPYPVLRDALMEADKLYSVEAKSSNPSIEGVS